MAKFEVTLSIGYANARHEDVLEIPDEELEGLTEKERADLLHEYWQDWANNYIDGGINEVGEE